MDDDAGDQLAPHLLPGETLVWVGRPDATRHLSAIDVFLLPFSVLWGGFAVFWVVAAVADGAGPFALLGLPFVGLGLYLIVGRFVYKASRKRRTVYGLTRGRALAVVGTGSVSDYPLRGTPVQQQQRSRAGDI